MKYIRKLKKREKEDLQREIRRGIDEIPRFTCMKNRNKGRKRETLFCREESRKRQPRRETRRPPRAAQIGNGVVVMHVRTAIASVPSLNLRISPSFFS